MSKVSLRPRLHLVGCFSPLVSRPRSKICIHSMRRETPFVPASEPELSNWLVRMEGESKDCNLIALSSVTLLNLFFLFVLFFLSLSLNPLSTPPSRQKASIQRPSGRFQDPRRQRTSFSRSSEGRASCSRLLPLSLCRRRRRRRQLRLALPLSAESASPSCESRALPTRPC